MHIGEQLAHPKPMREMASFTRQFRPIAARWRFMAARFYGGNYDKRPGRFCAKVYPVQILGTQA